MVCGVCRRAAPFVDDTAAHDKRYAPHGGQVLQRIALECDEIGFEARRNPADPLAQPQCLRRQRVRRHGLGHLQAPTG